MQATRRVKAYMAVRDLLPPGPVRVIEFGCRDGRGRLYLGERVRYLGLERSRVKYSWPGVDVRVGFDWGERADIPAGFDVGICLTIPRDMKPGHAVWRLGRAVKEDGMVFLGLRGFGEIDRVKRFFRKVDAWQTKDLLLVQCQGLKSAEEMAA